MYVGHEKGFQKESLRVLFLAFVRIKISLN